MATAKVLTEDEVNIPKIKEIIERAFLKATLDNDGDLIVYTDNGPRFMKKRLAKKRRAATPRPTSFNDVTGEHN